MDFYALILCEVVGTSVVRVWVGKLKKKCFPLLQLIKQLPVSKALTPHLLKSTGC